MIKLAENARAGEMFWTLLCHRKILRNVVEFIYLNRSGFWTKVIYVCRGINYRNGYIKNIAEADMCSEKS